MPWSFLRVYDGTSMPDLVGSEFDSLAEVAQAVRRSLVEMIAGAFLERNAVLVKIEVRDGQGRLVVGGSDVLPFLFSSRNVSLPVL